MKKKFSVLTLLTFVLAVLFLSVYAQKSEKIKVVTPQEISVKNVELLDIGGSFHVKFSILENLYDDIDGIGIKISGYDEGGKFLTCSSRSFKFAFKKFSTGSITRKVSENLRKSQNFKVEIVPLNETSLASFSGTCCNDCTNNAIRACGQGNVANVQCQEVETPGEGGSCSCDYTCKNGGGIDPENPTNP